MPASKGVARRGPTPPVHDPDGAYWVMTLAANSCLCAGCELLLPVLDSCLRPTPDSWGLLVCGTRAEPVRRGSTGASASVHGGGT